MALITNIIPAQNFELVRERIAIILKEELDNQYALTNDSDLNVKVFGERFVPFDHTETPAINVTLSRGDNDNQSAVNADGKYTYFIDVYTSARNTPTESGDTKSIIKLQRLMGVVRAIIHNPVYLTLGFPPPSIGHRSVSEMFVAEPNNKQDAVSNAMGRILLRVDVIETVELKNLNQIEGYQSEIRLNETDRGYLYE